MQNRGLSDERQFAHLIKASAGSGKTHRLTGEYLRLLYSKPNNYRHILAVTFTNKATDEMKSRIIQELYNLSADGKSDYLAQLSAEFALNEMQTRRQARTILENVLHDYSAFSISTIDRFFQQTMRAFTREMGLAGGYSVEVDDNAFLPEVIDTMLFELDKPENKELAAWLLAFMKDKIENNKGWNIKKDVQELAAEIFNEKYKSLSLSDKEKIHDKKHLAEYRKTLQKIVRSFEDALREIGTKGANLMRHFGLHYTDFKGGRNSPFSHFVKWANGEMKTPTATFLNLADNPDTWTTKTTPAEKRSAIESAYTEGLNELVKAAAAHFQNATPYFSARAILNYFFTLGILNDIQHRLQQLQQKENILFLSDTTELLNKIIADSDSPFIYEKTGARIHHYMIDEFQDTSAMQWNNFRPLMRESLAANNFNLIVGDVKQSIYRWRNSDWRLLEERVSEDLRSENIRRHVLDTNWRSDANVVRFNNAFFALAAKLLQADYNQSLDTLPEGDFKQNVSRKITDAYAQVHQLVPSKKDDERGTVQISFLDNCDKENDWKTEALKRIPLEIERLQRDGFRLKDIAIVVRWNSEAVAVAETLLAYKEAHPHSQWRYDIISNEALVIANAQSVKAVVALMRWFSTPADRTKKMLAVYEFYRFHHGTTPDEALSTFLGGTDELDFPNGVAAQLADISHLPLYELIEAFFALSKDALNEKENAYVQAFLDIALRFSTNASSNINDFLTWWDEKGHRKTLFSPDGQDAIRLVTIHKSKGLGFGAVLMPFADWTVDHNPHHSDIIWCRPNVEPFNQLDIVPLRYGNALMNTIFREDYLEEKLFTFIDNLNLLYVAFTRAKHRLVVFASKPSEKNSGNIKSVSDLLWLAITQSRLLLAENPQNLIPLEDHFSETDTEAHFLLGGGQCIEKQSEKETEESSKTEKWQSIPFNNRLTLRLNSAGFFGGTGKRDYGTLMHDLVSRVETFAHIPRAVERKIVAGELPETDRAKMTDELLQMLSIDGVSDWYSGKYTVLNEMQVLHPRFGFSRPDRVMLADGAAIVVDYKFGEVEDSKYIRQVRHYVRQVREMGYANVQGFVFYVKIGKVVNVL